MAQIEINTPHPDRGAPAAQILVNGIDMSDEVFASGIEIVTVGDDEFTEAGLRLTFSISNLRLNAESVTVTGNVDAAGERLAALLEQNETAGR